jgi:uncharacterized LabA/DUF88 family protein
VNNQVAVFIDFENIALWAEQEFLDFEITALMEYLQSRGPVVIKRAYGDWSRFSRYRDQLMDNSLDLIQMYSVRAGKNRADIRMAMDAQEVAMTRPQIQTFAIVSGDSDFGPLAARLREYGRYTLGIGPRDVTHPLLIKSCDEFVYLETVLGELEDAAAIAKTDHESARNLLVKALLAHAKRGEIPVLASRLKQTMLLMNSAFNEANFGYQQFKTWLESNADLVQLFVRDLELYAASLDYVPAIAHGSTSNAVNSQFIPNTPAVAEKGTKSGVLEQYAKIYERLKMNVTDFNTRRDVLRDFYRELKQHPGQRTTDELLDLLSDSYETQGVIRSKTTLRQIWQMGFRQRTYDYQVERASVHVPVWLAPDIDSEADFVMRAESGFIYAVVHAGLEIDLGKLASTLVSDPDQTSYIQQILDDLVLRNKIVLDGARYRLPSDNAVPLADEPVLQGVIQDIEEIQMPAEVERTPENAHKLAKNAMVQRSQDFAAAARNCLLACKIMWELLTHGETSATLDDLRWFMASYASVKAGELSQVYHDYAGSRPYYLAFFFLVQEDDPLWGRMRGLINPMLAYFWANAGRELGITVAGKATPAQSAIFAATHSRPELRSLWLTITRALAEVNPSLLRRVTNQMRLNRDATEYHDVSQQLETILNGVA